MFFSFDGIDGVGKTTQIELFAEWLNHRGLDVVVFRDPGGTKLSEMVRNILLQSSDDTQICNQAEMLLYMSARAQLVHEKIVPSLEAGKTVIADRYVLATLAYQGHGGLLSCEQIRAVGDVATQGRYPDLTFLLDLDPKTSDARRNREPDRVEQRGISYLQRVRDGFLAEAKAQANIVVIDANATVQDIQDEIQSIAEKMLEGG